MGKEKSDAGKVPAKVETIHLKVFIHCEGCRKKVKKILNNVEGVHTVEVDSALGKATVTGTADSKTLIKKLEKSGKVAELWPSQQGGKGNQQKDQPQQQKGGGKKEAKEGEEEDEKQEGGGKGGGKSSGGGGGGGESSNKGNNGGGGGGGGNGEGGKKKKGGGGGDGNGGGDEFSEASSSSRTNTASKNVAPVPSVVIESGYPGDSADYATHMFSDENANNCYIM